MVVPGWPPYGTSCCGALSLLLVPEVRPALVVYSDDEAEWTVVVVDSVVCEARFCDPCV